MRKALAILALALTAATAAPASADEFCGRESSTTNGITASGFANLSTYCKAGGSCQIMGVTDGGLEVFLERASVDGPWLAGFGSPTPIDVGEGVDIQIAGTEPTRVAPEFLIASEDAKIVRVDNDVSEVVVADMMKASSISAQMVLVGGGLADGTVPLDRLADAISWVDCAQKSLK